MFKKNLFIILTTIVFFVACKPVAQESSSLQWGHLTDALSGYKLISVAANEKLEICGHNPQVTTWAVLSWANAIGRADILSKNIVPCGSGARRNVTVTLQNAGANYAPAWTAATAVTVNTGAMQSEDSPFYRAILLHEIGHAWGMCDQYGAADKNMNCATQNPKDASEVMGNTDASKQSLTQGDIKGLAALAASAPANGWTNVGSSGSMFGAQPRVQIPELPYGQGYNQGGTGTFAGNTAIPYGNSGGMYPGQSPMMGGQMGMPSISDSWNQMAAYLAIYMAMNQGQSMSLQGK